MKIQEHEGFEIQIHNSGSGFIAEVYRKGKLLHTVYEKGVEKLPFTSSMLSVDAAREWIDKTYFRKIIYKGYIQASLGSK